MSVEPNKSTDPEAWAFTPAHPRADLYIDRLLQSSASEIRLNDEYRILTVCFHGSSYSNLFGLLITIHI